MCRDLLVKTGLTLLSARHESRAFGSTQKMTFLGFGMFWKNADNDYTNRFTKDGVNGFLQNKKLLPSARDFLAFF